MPSTGPAPDFRNSSSPFVKASMYRSGARTAWTSFPIISEADQPKIRSAALFQ